MRKCLARAAYQSVLFCPDFFFRANRVYLNDKIPIPFIADSNEIKAASIIFRKELIIIWIVWSEWFVFRQNIDDWQCLMLLFRVWNKFLFDIKCQYPRCQTTHQVNMTVHQDYINVLSPKEDLISLELEENQHQLSTTKWYYSTHLYENTLENLNKENEPVVCSLSQLFRIS